MIYIILTLLGLAFGSFINALVWRMHQKYFAKRLASYSVVTGRSMCSSCKHPLGVSDLIPVVSWLLLKGRCRYCSAKIEDSPFPEITTPLLFVFSYSVWPFGFVDLLSYVLFSLWLILGVIIIALVVFDVKWMLLPDKLTLPFFIVSIVFVIIRANILDEYLFLESLAGMVTIGSLFYLLQVLSKGEWIGGGDIKIGFGLGLLAGSVYLSLLLIFFASLLGIIVMLPPLLRGKAVLKMKIPFGPFLLTAGVAIVLFGPFIQDYFEALFYAPTFSTLMLY